MANELSANEHLGAMRGADPETPRDTIEEHDNS